MAFGTSIDTTTKFLRVGNLIASLLETDRYEEAATFAREWVHQAKRELGEKSEIYRKIRWGIMHSLEANPRASRDDIIEAVAMWDEEVRRARRTYGPSHPWTVRLESDFTRVRSKLASFNAES